jgi:single-stranded DNA-binding protein
MHCQLYLSGGLATTPELLQTKKGKLMVKLVMATALVRETRPSEYQTEEVTLPVTFFAGPAEAVKDLHKGAALTVGCHLYGTEFNNEGVIKRGVQIIADVVFMPRTCSRD